jgi:subtilisin family serine protease
MSFNWKRARVVAHLSGAASLLALFGGAANAQQVAATSGRLSAAVQARFSSQLKTFQVEKSALTPAQRKLSTALALSIPAKKARVSQSLKAFRGFAAASADGRSDVIITASQVTPNLLSAITRFGGQIDSVLPGGKAVRALISAAGAEKVAALDEVRFIRLYRAPQTRVGPRTSEGDTAHAAAPTRELFRVGGKGIKIGVISDGIKTLALSQKNGELPAKVGVVRNAAGKLQSGDGDEGTAMLEIVHDIAPDAQLLFASGNGGQEVFADNIRRLRKAGCDIIVDDLIYFAEGVYQDGTVAQAVNDVVADGALYFSAAGNDGNLKAGTSSTWDGQFRAGPTFSTTKGLAKIHLWDGEESNVIQGLFGSSLVFLQWADPLEASTNDYDLYVIDETGEIVSASQDVQDGSNSAYEEAYGAPGDKVVVTLNSGVERPLRLYLIGGTLTQATSSAVYGHSAAKNCIGVAAVPALDAVGGPFDRTQQVEDFSSDGFRTYYFDPSGKKQTFTVRTPQIAAADGVTTSVAGFTRFYGTSAAAPHAAAIAALIWSNDRTQKAEDVKSIMYGSTIDIMGSGFDRESGNGIVMVDRAFAKIGPAVLSLPTTSIRVNEGNTGTKTIKVTVNLSKASDKDVTVNYTTLNGTARAGSDFESKSGTLTIPKGAKSVDVFFDIKGDKLDEEDETFQIRFDKNTAFFRGSRLLTVTILDDDGAPSTPAEDSSKSS